ncbi:hypothetical protein KF707_11545 [Candidatus Obscuribacterales bacterium]|jgi:hypothetical protein|nr:hypothetical protein [Candidatus Obscuribacterales bacterium]MBX3136863.1 hypothetical protein [Candidatus Obscuribacterales bacterium]MBX3154094.1 hypothetical protein [Candidatus Obscuribacterales bacterium]
MSAKFIRLILILLVVAIACPKAVWAGKDESNLSAEEQALVNALLFNLIRQRQQQPPPPPPPPPPPDKGPAGEEAPQAPPGDGPAGPK